MHVPTDTIQNPVLLALLMGPRLEAKPSLELARFNDRLSFWFLFLRQETDTAVRTVTTSLEEKSGGRFLLLWTGDFHDAACGRRCV